jgi:protease-4
MSEHDNQTPHEPGQQSEQQPDPWTQSDEVKADQRNVKAEKKTGHDADESWERQMISRLAYSALEEQRKSRRWNIFFRSVFLLYLLLLLFYIPGDWGGESIKGGKHTSLVEIQGVIADNTPANADTVIGGLRAAFKDKNTVGVILKINSPGGSPVQAGYINDEIVRLREKYPNIPLYAVISDICASGGYYIASAADEIYADKASIVGSIGVLMDGFGFTKAMDKLGVERRLLTAGEHKGFLDPFSPAKQEDIMHVKGLLGNIHKQFIDTVKQGRAGRLKEIPELFSGLVWTGEQSLELGLIDGLGSAGYVAREIIGEDNIVDYTYRPSFFDRFADRIGVTLGNTVLSTIGMAPYQNIR